jgi:hypothetical protein
MIRAWVVAGWIACLWDDRVGATLRRGVVVLWPLSTWVLALAILAGEGAVTC